MDRTDRFDRRLITVSVRSGELDRKMFEPESNQTNRGSDRWTRRFNQFPIPSLIPLSCGPSSTLGRPIDSSINQSKPIFFHPPPHKQSLPPTTPTTTTTELSLTLTYQKRPAVLPTRLPIAQKRMKYQILNFHF